MQLPACALCFPLRQAVRGADAFVRRPRFPVAAAVCWHDREAGRAILQHRPGMQTVVMMDWVKLMHILPKSLIPGITTPAVLVVTPGKFVVVVTLRILICMF